MAEALRRAAALLPGPTARLDAELLLSTQMGHSREDMLLRHMQDVVNFVDFAPLVERRARGEPVAYITGQREFWSLGLRVTPDVLIPRPDSETLIEVACRLITLGAAPRVLDLGTGSGALLLAALSQWPRAWGLGVDRSAAALGIARANAAALGFGSRAAFVEGDWATALAGGWNLVLSNPPYIATDFPLAAGVGDHEPAAALFAGVDGLDAYRSMIPQLGGLLAPDGVAVVEIGYNQAEAVGRIARDNALDVEIARDLGDRDRALILRTTPI